MPDMKKKLTIIPRYEPDAVAQLEALKYLLRGHHEPPDEEYTVAPAANLQAAAEASEETHPDEHATATS